MKYFTLLFPLLFTLQVFGHVMDSTHVKLGAFIQSLQGFSKNIPQEKVYLHLDNTSYYQGDNIWFACYVVTAAQHQLSRLSKTLYVELLSPNGELVDKRILKVENGRCHGEFTLSQLPFYSGFYEVRAYTKYMLNFGEDAIFSRLLPVFNKPKEEGNFEEKEMLKYGKSGVRDYPMKREPLLMGKTVNLRFFPEGGSLIQGVEARVAVEATDEVGNPIAVKGSIVNEEKRELLQFSTWHEGRGIFTYTPKADRQEAVVEYLGKKYSVDLPTALPQGVAMEVDNLSHRDSIEVTLRRNTSTPAEMLGVVVVSGGKLQNRCLAYVADEKFRFKMDKSRLPSGVSQVVLFNSKGEILGDRLIFTSKNNFLDITAKANKAAYRPHELVEMEVALADKKENPVSATFSLSVRDGANEVEGKHNILTDLLLMSEIKGYVRNPFYYFEKDDSTRRAALDQLLMVQGWRRYSWRQMAGVDTFEVKYFPEQGVEVNGKVVTFVRQKPRPNVDVSLFLHKKEESSDSSVSHVESFVTNEQGRFSFVSELQGRWSMILSATEKGKPKDHRILLDRLFSPAPKRYNYVELQVNLAQEDSESLNEEKISAQLEDDSESFLAAYKDSLARVGIDEKMHLIDEVRVKARRTPAQDIHHNRSTAVAHYDVASEASTIYDKGQYVGNDIHELLKNMSEHFSTVIGGDTEILFYKIEKQIITKFTYQPQFALVVINYEQPEHLLSYQDNLNFAAIKTIYINESQGAIASYMPHRMKAEMFGCAVFIETHPEGKIPVEGAKGVRKTFLEGYSPVKEFYSPNYSELPPVSDYRRTLYWNPSVATDENGRAKVTFYNNSSSKKFSISAETITPQGAIGIYKRKK
ncbi:MAG: hypothetical protein LBU92_05015 [Prevotellaceae bacterium]|jgi:hypothetical protein|nr:hypothetical protein [Prevotellaceae bacterium]